MSTTSQAVRRQTKPTYLLAWIVLLSAAVLLEVWSINQPPDDEVEHVSPR